MFDSFRMLECEAHNNEFGQSHHGARMNRMRPIRVCIVGPSPYIVGGQAVQAQRLCTRLVRSEELEVTFLPVNPRMVQPLRFLQRVKYVRTVLTSFIYGLSLLRRVPRMDVI